MSDETQFETAISEWLRFALYFIVTAGLAGVGVLGAASVLLGRGVIPI